MRNPYLSHILIAWIICHLSFVYLILSFFSLLFNVLHNLYIHHHFNDTYLQSLQNVFNHPLKSNNCFLFSTNKTYTEINIFCLHFLNLYFFLNMGTHWGIEWLKGSEWFCSWPLLWMSELVLLCPLTTQAVFYYLLVPNLRCKIYEFWFIFLWTLVKLHTFPSFYVLDVWNTHLD